MASPVVRGSAVLKDVAVAPDGSVYAVGLDRATAAERTEPLVERYDGRAWSVEHADGLGQLSAVAIQPDGSPLAVGWQTTADGDRILTMRDTGASWNAVPEATGDPGRLSAIAVGEATVAVGLRFVDGIRSRWWCVSTAAGCPST